MPRSVAAGGAATFTGVPPGLSDMFAPSTAGGTFKHGMLYCYAKPIAQSRKIFERAAGMALLSAPSGCDSVKAVVRIGRVT